VVEGNRLRQAEADVDVDRGVLPDPQRDRLDLLVEARRPDRNPVLPDGQSRQDVQPLVVRLRLARRAGGDVRRPHGRAGDDRALRVCDDAAEGGGGELLRA
jgi:hypothetical protein